MAWDDEMVTILRNIIQDTSTTPTYSDDQLSELVLVTAQGIQVELNFGRVYDISISNGSIKPDPTSSTSRDINFITLVCLKAASNLVNAELRSLTRQGISIQDGDNKISLQRSPQSLQLMQETYKSMYDSAVYAFKTGGSDGLGEIVVNSYNFISEYWGEGPQFYRRHWSY